MSIGNKTEKEFYGNGLIKCEACYKWGKRDGMTRKFYPNGRIEMEAIFRDDKPDGYFRQFYENGNIMAEETYDKGRLTAQKNFDMNGKLTDVARFFYRNGKVRMEVSFSEGIPEGISRRFYENGAVMAEENYKKGVLISSRRYDKEGKGEGPIKEFYDCGDIRCETDYKYGIYREYFEGGKIKIDARFKGTTPHGLIREYNEAGNLISEDNYENGILNGSRRYDPLGRVVSSSGTLRIKSSEKEEPSSKENVYKDVIERIPREPYEEEPVIRPITEILLNQPPVKLEPIKPERAEAAPVPPPTKPVEKKETLPAEKTEKAAARKPIEAETIVLDKRSVGSKLNGLQKEYYDSGELMAEVLYKDGVIEAETRYDKKGNFIYKSKRQDANYM